MEENDNLFTQITDNLETVITGVPAPLRKNFFKAFGQLCSASMDIPVSWLEGKADLIRATNEARRNIIKKSGEEISKGIDIPQVYIDKAVTKYASKIIKEQIVLDDITSKAATELVSSNIGIIDDVKEISDEWLNEFESNARNRCSEDMKIAFAKILAGEISNPGKFSIRALKIFSQLDKEVGRYFQILCNLAITVYHKGEVLDSRVVVFDSNPNYNSLSKYGLSLYQLTVLQEYGLIITQLKTYKPYDNEMFVGNINNTVKLAITFQNKDYGLLPINRNIDNGNPILNGIKLTKAGEELLSIIPFLDVSEYKNDLINYFKMKNLSLAEIV